MRYGPKSERPTSIPAFDSGLPVCAHADLEFVGRQHERGFSGLRQRACPHGDADRTQVLLYTFHGGHRFIERCRFAADGPCDLQLVERAGNTSTIRVVLDRDAKMLPQTDTSAKPSPTKAMYMGS